MDERTDTLMCKAVAAELSPDEREEWEALCRKEPKLLEELEELKQVASRLERGVEVEETLAREETPDELPEYVRRQLEQTRKAVFPQEARSGSLLGRLRRWLRCPDSGRRVPPNREGRQPDPLQHGPPRRARLRDQHR